MFANVLLADEINRPPPQTQAALHAARQERQVTVAGVADPRPDPFLVIGTQNPIEYEGTDPLPEAQLDRFLLRLDVGYPDRDQEIAILRLPLHGVLPAGLEHIQPVKGRAERLESRGIVDGTKVSDEVAEYVVSIVRATEFCRMWSSERALARPSTCWRRRARIHAPR